MDRRQLLAGGAAAALMTGLDSETRTAVAATAGPGSAERLNPPGIRVAGIRMLPVVGGNYKVWTKKVGSGPVKVLLLHGGPGFSHEYLEAMESFLPQAGIEMYYYDQLGANNSDQPDDPALWTLPRYVEEVEEVRHGLGLEQFVLYGHSWGGILAMEYSLKYQRHLRGLVISNMTAGMKSYQQRTATLKSMLSSASRTRLDELEAKQDYDSPDYDRIVVGELYPKMLCRIQPWPEPLTRTFRHVNKKIYVQMQGKSEFQMTGNLKDWEFWDRLPEIRTKALTVGARYDEMDPDDMQRMAAMMPNARCAICPDGSHHPMWDDQAFYFRHLLEYLRTI